MTYRGHARTVGCFDDDAYTYQVLPAQILILAGNAHSCFWQKGQEHFPIHLDVLRP
jgi:hypothetical protein